MKRAVLFFATALLCGAGFARAQILPDINAYLENASGATGTASLSENSPVDLLFESDSYVPPFYKGRSLPSPGSTIYLQAIAHFTNAAGATIPDSQIIYTWRRNGRVEGSVSGIGKSNITLPSPTLFGNDRISVEASTADKSSRGSASVTIASLDPRVSLYQEHPLFGVEYHRELMREKNDVSDIEMSFVAVPFFAAARSADDPRLSYVWSVNGIPIAATSSNSNRITVNADNSTGLAHIGLMLTSRANPLLQAEGDWNMSFDRINTTGLNLAQ